MPTTHTASLPGPDSSHVAPHQRGVCHSSLRENHGGLCIGVRSRGMRLMNRAQWVTSQLTHSDTAERLLDMTSTNVESPGYFGSTDDELRSPRQRLGAELESHEQAQVKETAHQNSHRRCYGQ
jgi:hypothetical protein